MSLIHYLDASPGWQRLIRENAPLRSFVGRRRGNAGLEVMPGIYSDSPEFLAMTEWLVEQLEADPRLQPAVQKNGLSANGLAGGYARLLTVAGYRAYPTQVAQEDNSGVRAEKDLPSNWLEERHRAIAMAIYRRMLGRGKPAPCRIKKQATTGVPDMTRDIDVKKRHYLNAMNILREHRTTYFRPTQFLKYGIVPVCLSVTRSQDDMPSKIRYVDTGYGRLVVSDKQLKDMPPHIAQRIRLAFAASGTGNYAWSGLLACNRAAYFDTYGFTYKHRGPEHVASKLNRFRHIWSIDVSAFDSTVPDFFFEILPEALADYLQPSVISLMMAYLGAPVLSTAPYDEVDMERMNLKWPTVGDPDSDEGYALTRGLLSGIAGNPDLGKSIMTIEILCRLDSLRTLHPDLDMLVDDHVNLDVILKGNHRLVAFLNSTDDNLFGDNIPKLKELFLAAKGYFQIDPEEQPVYLGSTYTGEPGTIVGLPNLTSFLVRMLVPEHAIGVDEEDRRAFWMTGWRARKQIYSQHPEFMRVYRLLDDACTRFLGAGVEAIMMRRPEPTMTSVFQGADAVFITNPDSIYYLIDPADVTPALLANELATIDQGINTALSRPLTGPKFTWLE